MSICERITAWWKRKMEPERFHALHMPDGTRYYWFGRKLHPAHELQLRAMHRKPDSNPFAKMLGGGG